MRCRIHGFEGSLQLPGPRLCEFEGKRLVHVKLCGSSSSRPWSFHKQPVSESTSVVSQCAPKIPGCGQGRYSILSTPEANKSSDLHRCEGGLCQIARCTRIVLKSVHCCSIRLPIRRHDILVTDIPRSLNGWKLLYAIRFRLTVDRNGLISAALAIHRRREHSPPMVYPHKKPMYMPRLTMPIRSPQRVAVPLTFRTPVPLQLSLQFNHFALKRIDLSISLT